MGFYQDFLDGLKDLYGPGKRFASESELAAFVGVAPAQIYKYTHECSTRNIARLGAILDRLDLRLTPAEQPGLPAAREVCFVDARLTPAGERQTPPDAEDYMAVPLVEEVGAGPGIIPQGGFLSWFLVYKHQDAVRYRRDLIAVQIGRNSTSMQPILHPGDIVLVDREDKSTRIPGHMMLVMDPDGAGKIKRVAVEAKNVDFRIIY
jgi:phage repressor protein C with HTH and peptisase S24 domain